MTIHSWSYEDRSTCQEIIPRVWLGPYQVVKNNSLLQQLGITDIVFVRSSLPGPEQTLLNPALTVLPSQVIQMDDNTVSSSLKIFSFFENFLRERLQESEQNVVLVVGLAGINRSASLLVAYIIKKQQMSVEQAIQTLTDRRRCVSISFSLRRQLAEFSLTHSVAEQPPVDQPRPGKRVIIETL
jgi:serine/threonine/tyrosine-interacting protein